MENLDSQDLKVDSVEQLKCKPLVATAFAKYWHLMVW